MAGTGPRVAVLCGLGGCGKTSVALEYAHRHSAEFGMLWQFPAEEPMALAAGFGDLAAQLGGRGVLDAADPVAQVHAVLAACPQEWLLIFDNAPSPAQVERMLPPAGKGRVLITSQTPLWAGTFTIEVPVLDRDAATAFLQARTGDADPRAAELAEELGGLPLALEQAAAYMLSTGRSTTSYLDLLRRRRRDLLARGEPARYGKQVATTWALAFDQLQRTAPQGIALLRLLACCAPENVPLSLLLEPRPGISGELPAELVPLLEDPLAADDALAALRRFSLVSAPRDGRVSMHRLVQAVSIGQLDGDQADVWRQAARSLVDAALPDDPEQPGAWPIYAALLPHAEVTLRPESQGMERVARFLGASGNYAAARTLYWQISCAREEVLGGEHPDTLAARANFATRTGDAGAWASARDQLASLLPVLERVLGAEHPETLSARHDLARWTGNAGDVVGARDQYADLLPIRERIQGPEHPRTLVTRANLAYYTGAAGDVVGARDQYAALLPIRERVSGPEHPYTLTARGNLARWTGEAGDVAGARDQYAVLVRVRERVLGPEHPYTLKARENLARWTGEAGDAAGARDLYAALLPARERVSGAEHPDTLAARRNLAYWAEQAGDTDPD